MYLFIFVVARVALAGLASGAWFGLFVGLLISLFGSAEGFSVFAAVLIGAAFGLLFGLISYAFTGGRRDFTSTSQIVASEYRLLCLGEQAGQAMQLLTQLSRDGGPQSVATTAPTSAPTVAQPVDRPFGSPDATPATPEEESKPAEPVSGPTYGEMIDRKRREENNSGQ